MKQMNVDVAETKEYNKNEPSEKYEKQNNHETERRPAMRQSKMTLEEHKNTRRKREEELLLAVVHVQLLEGKRNTLRSTEMKKERNNPRSITRNQTNTW